MLISLALKGLIRYLEKPSYPTRAPEAVEILKIRIRADVNLERFKSHNTNPSHFISMTSPREKKPTHSDSCLGAKSKTDHAPWVRWDGILEWKSVRPVNHSDTSIGSSFKR